MNLILESEKICGIYRIKNIVNNKFYIGSSNNIRTRFFEHISALNNQRHHNDHLQKSFNKYGTDLFQMELIEKCKESKLLEIEQNYINCYYDKEMRKFAKECYNNKPNVGGAGAGELHHCYGLFAPNNPTAKTYNVDLINYRTGEVIYGPIKGAKDFARNVIKIHGGDFIQLLLGKLNSCRGWAILKEENRYLIGHPLPEYTIHSKIFNFDIVNRLTKEKIKGPFVFSKKMAQNLNVNYENFCKMLNGRTKSCKKWNISTKENNV